MQIITIAKTIGLSTFLILLHVTAQAQDFNTINTALDSLMKARSYSECLTLAEESLNTSKWNTPEEIRLEYARCKCATLESTNHETIEKYCTVLYNKSKELDLDKENERELYSSVEVLRGGNLHELDDYQENINILNALITKLQSYGDDVFNLKTKKIIPYRQMTDFDSMKELLDELEEEYKAMDTKDITKQKTILRSRIQYANGIGDYGLGRKYLDRAIEMGLTADPIDYLYLRHQYNSLGINYFLSGDYGKSAYNLEKALEAILNIKEEKNVNALFNNLGLIYAKLKDHDRSNMFYQKSLKYDRMRYGENHTAIARTNFNIGVTEHEKGDFESALEYLFEALKVRKKLLKKDHADIAHTQQIIANTYLQIDNYEKAIQYIEKCLPTFTKIYDGKHEEIAWSYNVMAKSYLGMDKFPQAREAVNNSYQSVSYDPKQEDYDFEEMETPFVLFSPLETDFKISVEQYKKSGDLSVLQVLDKKEDVFNDLLFYLTRNSDVSMHKVHAPRVQRINEIIIEKNYLKFEESGDQKYLAEIFQKMEKSKNTFLTENKVEKEMLSFSGVPKSLLIEQSSIIDSIAELQFAISKFESGTEDYVSTQNRIAEFKDRQADILLKLENDFPNYYQLKYEHAVCSLEELQASCNEDETWLNYFWGDDNVYLFTTNNVGSKIYQLPENDKIEKSLEKFQNAILDRTVQHKLDKYAQELYTALIAPAKPSDGEKLNFVLDDQLSSIPFEILQNEQGRYVLETNPVQYYLSSTLALDPFKGGKNSNGALVMAPHFEGEKEISKQYAMTLDNEVLRGELATLKGATKELGEIKSLLSAKALGKTHATESKFKQDAHKYNILHLATHGLIDERKPNFSKLAFAQEGDDSEDGFLHTYEIYGLSLNADLVTLSACNTGTGKSTAGEGIASLGRAFAYAGCPNSVMSLWSVNDQSTAELMRLFYKNIKDGNNKADALRNAKLEFIKTQPKAFQSPFYWAGFVYYGDNLPLELSNSVFTSNALGFGLLGSLLLFLLWYFKRDK